MLKPICLSTEHQILLHNYISYINTYIKDITNNDEKYEDFIQISNIIIEHHNNYQSNNLGQANYNDFLSIIPTHFSCMVNGYLTGLETEDNRQTVRLYRHIISEKSFDLIEDISKLKTIYD
jgi:collagenase-like PrtC family protease|tara:strand:+ start:582 stop:944 length:363 start_codon:yes stop_codon:yes gene_type:complete